jgi:lysophospholipase L1-like esterase
MRIQKSAVLVAKSTPFQKHLENPSLRILVLGDSTAVGTGSDDVRESTSGRLSVLYHEAEIVNMAVNGLKIEGLLDILFAIPPTEHFDIILIQIGANDIIRMTPLSTIKSGIEEVLAKTRVLGDSVLVLHAGDIGQVPFFPWYVGALMHYRSLRVQSIYSEAAKNAQAEYVDLLDSTVGATLRQDPERYYASDGLHLRGDGYGLWFREISKHLPKK